ncbi:acyl-CoA dehydrogenase family protein [Peristeroidobacter soli]|uniref:acyl-CoA dehydrogenase family protein n=1 Tax=Peristeroidobacter soli TaxID=2497877 RepID=UPI00101C9C56|nr:acyl-CoA dehydrogenase family protein [Peristeroidobacter soli]
MNDVSLGAWELPQELALLRDTVRKFMATEVRPVEDGVEHDAYKLPPEKLAPLQKKVKDEMGLWCYRTPAKYGGAGLGLLAQTVVAEQTAQCKMGLYSAGCGAFGADPPNVIWEGSREQIEGFGIPSVAQGKKAYVAISEASGGSDPARSIRTRAVRDGDHYVVNGSKMWISAADTADWGILFARTGDDTSRGGITAFIVDGRPEGMTVRPIPVIRSWSPCEVAFKDVRIPVAHRLGEEGEGFNLAKKWLVETRIPYSITTLGVAQAALDMAVKWSTERKTFGSYLADKQAIQWMLADSEIEIRAARLLTYQAAWKADLGQDPGVDASIAKLTTSETAGRVIDRCVQIFGALGVSEELPLERWYRELRIRRIGEGPSEVQRMVVARSLISQYR